MIKSLRDFANWIEVESCNIKQGWNKFLDKRKVRIHHCKNCLCEK